MASRRMFSARLTESTRFLKMPSSSQNLYFHLGMNADDDGVVEAYPVMCTTGATEDDLRVLVSKGYVTLLNSDMVAYLNDWLEHNNIRPDRKVDSIYQNLLVSVVPDVVLKEARPTYYSRKKLICPTNDGQGADKVQTIVSIGKDSIGKDSIGEDSIGKDKEERESINYQLIADMYNDTCVSFPRLTKLSDERKKAIRARMKRYSIEDFRKLFQMSEESSFLKGQNARNWSATFDWLIKDANMAKVLDGNYANKQSEQNNQEEKGGTRPHYSMDYTDEEKKLLKEATWLDEGPFK